MGLHIAAASISCSIPSDIFSELVRTDDLITQPLQIINGQASVPQGIGLCVSLDYAAVEKYKTGQILTSSLYEKNNRIMGVTASM